MKHTWLGRHPLVANVLNAGIVIFIGMALLSMAGQELHHWFGV